MEYTFGYKKCEEPRCTVLFLLSFILVVLGNVGMMAKKMETRIVYLGVYMVLAGLYCYHGK